MSEESTSEERKRPRRRGWARALVVLASILAFAAILAIWANRQVLNTDNWTNTSTELLENEIIRDQIAVYIVDQLYANVDVAAELEGALPERLQPLAGPAAGGLRQLAEQASKEALARPRAQEAWAAANRNAQLALLRILEDEGPVLSNEGGDVTLDLKALLEQMQERVGIGGRLQERLPDSAAQITIMRADRLDAAQTALKVLRGLPIVLVALSLAFFGLALALAPGWRREALRAYGIGFVIAGALALIVQDQAGQALVDALTATASMQPVGIAAWTISTTLLVQAAWATIGYGVFMVFAAWLGGPTRAAVAVRRAVAPYARHPGVAYAFFAVFVALLLWWGPTPATRDPVLALILVALLAIATEVLRRKIVREHPDADMGESLDRMRERARRVWSRGDSTGGSAAVADGERLERLERLGRLKETGVLDEQEFAAQKRQILDEPGDGPGAADGAAPVSQAG
jgi:hypothetical protein